MYAVTYISPARAGFPQFLKRATDSKGPGVHDGVHRGRFLQRSLPLPTTTGSLTHATSHSSTPRALRASLNLHHSASEGSPLLLKLFNINRKPARGTTC
jgi:hypothetical protein